MDWSTWASIFARCSLTLGHNAIWHFLGVCMTGWPSRHSHVIFAWEFANSSKSIREFSHQVISGFDALGTLMFLLQMVLLLLLSEWVLCLLGFYWVEWSWQHSSFGPQLTFCMLEGPGEQDLVCLQCTSMCESCMVGLQECLVARGRSHGGSIQGNWRPIVGG